MGRVEGKVVIVSGGATGLGESHVRTLVGEGARVVLTDVKEEQGRAVAADLGDAVHFVTHDVTEEDGWRNVLRETLATFLAPYNTSKAAVTMLTKSVALHTGQYGIRCNSVHPGTVMTPMVQAFIDQSPDPEGGLERMRLEHPMGTVGEPSDVSGIVLYLASDESKFATGGEYRIDGGLAL